MNCSANISGEEGDCAENPVMSFPSKNKKMGLMFSLQVMHSIVISWPSFSQEIFTCSSLAIYKRVQTYFHNKRNPF